MGYTQRGNDMAVNDSDVQAIIRRTYTIGFRCGFDSGLVAGRRHAARARIETLILVGAVSCVIGLLLGMVAP